MSSRGWPVVAAAASAAILAGCSFVRADAPTPVSLDAWSDLPLPPSADLTQHALGPDSPCIVTDEPGPQPLRLLVQDRHLQDSAAFFIASPAHFCSATLSAFGSSSGIGPPLEPTNEALKIDDRGGGTIGDRFVEQLGGRVSVSASQVVVRFGDGRAVTASVANGYWLASWPKAEALPVRVVALDAIGLEVASVNVPVPGEPIEP